MKNHFIKIYALILGLVFASCLDDDKYALDPEGTKNIIEFLNPASPASPAGSIYPAFATSYMLAPEATYQIIVSYSGPEDDNDRDIELKLGVDPTALLEYNKHMTQGLYGNPGLNGTTYDLMPEQNYELNTTTVTIPRGQRTATVSITVYPELFDFTKNYAIPLRIVSSSYGTLSAHYSAAILAIGVRNDYDGVYDIIEGAIARNSGSGPDPALSGDYISGLTLELTTLSSNTVAIEPVWKDGSGIAGIDGTYLTIDPATNEVTVKSSNPSLKNIAGAENSYDPETQTFTLNFDWGAAPNTRVITGLKLQYSEPRP